MSPEFRPLPTDSLIPDPSQPRKTFLAESLERLRSSVSARGVLTPIRVMPDLQRQVYLILTGESRWRAAKLAGLTEVPCLIIDGPVQEEELLADRITENEVRNDLRPLELARAVVRLKLLKNVSSQTLAKELGLSASSITMAESLLSLPVDIQEQVDSGAIPESTAYQISRLPTEQSQREMAQAVVEGKATRTQVSEAVQRIVGKKNTKPKDSRLCCRLEGGMAVSISAQQALSWEEVIAALDRIRREAKKLAESGREVSALSQAIKLA